MKLIEAALHEAEKVSCTLSGETFSGWRSKSLWPNSDFGHNPIVDAWWKKLSEINVRLFLGPSTLQPGFASPSENLAWIDAHSGDNQCPLFAFPDLPPYLIPEFAKTGEWSAYGHGGTFAPVVELLKGIWRKAPFEVLLANPFALHATLLTPLSEKDVVFVSSAINSVANGSGDHMNDELKSVKLGFELTHCADYNSYCIQATARYIRVFHGFKLFFL